MSVSGIRNGSADGWHLPGVFLAFSLATFIMAWSSSMGMPMPFAGRGLLTLSAGDLLLSAMVPGRQVHENDAWGEGEDGVVFLSVRPRGCDSRVSREQYAEKG